MVANLLILNKRCEFFYMGENVAAPIAHCAASQLAETLGAVCGSQVEVEFHTTCKPEDVAADLKKYGKRLAAIGSGWSRGAFAPKVVRGHVFPTVFQCTLSRKGAC